MRENESEAFERRREEKRLVPCEVENPILQVKFIFIIPFKSLIASYPLFLTYVSTYTLTHHVYLTK